MDYEMTVIEADGLSLEIGDNAHGPAVRAAGDADAFGYILNNAMRGLVPDLEERLERGEQTWCGDMFVSRPDPSDDLRAPTEKWQRISDRDPGNDIYFIGVAGLGNLVVVPRSTLLNLLRQLKTLSRNWIPLTSRPSGTATVSRPLPSQSAVPNGELE
jgi:hypothetical protein